MKKPKLLLDSNIPDSLGRFDAKRIRKTIQQGYRQVISPNTVIERMNGVVGAKTDAHLANDQEKLRILVGGSLNALEFPADFAFRKAGVFSAVPKFSPADVEGWVKVILAAKNLSDLTSGNVKMFRSSSRLRAGLNVEAVTRQAEDVKREHREWLTRVIAATTPFITPAEWIGSIAAQLEVDLPKAQLDALTISLGAAYEYLKETVNRAKGSGTEYNVSAHDGDYHDSQLLYYLADPALYILTDDQNIKTKSQASPQSSRVLLLKDF